MEEAASHNYGSFAIVVLGPGACFTDMIGELRRRRVTPLCVLRHHAEILEVVERRRNLLGVFSSLKMLIVTNEYSSRLLDAWDEWDPVLVKELF
jgi:hypothetical protein